MLEKKSRYIFLVLFLWGIACFCAFSQANDTLQSQQNALKVVITDSIEGQKISNQNLKKDINIYRKITSFFRKRKITKNLTSSVFSSSPLPQKKISSPKFTYDYTPFQGKIIRKIHITSLDPFGFDEKNLDKKPTKKLDIYGNALHNKTSRRTIERELLFAENTQLDSTLLKESERILRDKNYIRRVQIRPVDTQQKTDSVDIEVNVLDSWTMYFTADLTDKRSWVRVSERNLFGLGHEISLLYRQYFKTFGDNGRGIYYRAKNVANTQIDAVTSYYTDDYENEFSKRIVIERPLLSTYTRWTTRLGVYENQYKEAIFANDSVYFPMLKTRIYDGYGGYVFPLKKEKTGQMSNIILSMRLKKTDFYKKPDVFLNIDDFYADEQLFLSKISLNSYDFVHDRYIFRQGDIEDVSIGHSFFVNTGFLNKNKQILPYIGLGFSIANYTKKGYFSADIEFGSLLLQNKTQQTTFRSESIYFSNLFSAGNWNFRQFLKSTFVVGFNRNRHIKDRVSINESDGILGFNSNIYGTRKLILTTQTQAYSPFYWLGFRFNPFFNIDLGFIGAENKPFFTTEVFSKVALGFYISNDYLMFQSFQFSLCYYPRIPDAGTHIFKITNHQNDDFKLQSFQHRLPDLVIYK